MKTKHASLISYGAYILSLLIFGTNGLYVANISLSSGHIVLMRTLIGGFVLTCLCLLRGGFDRESIRTEKWMLVLGGAALGLNWVALFEAYRMLNVSLATLIYYVGPMLVLLLSPVLFREKLSGKKILSAGIVAAGLVCISGSIVVSGMNFLGLVVAFVVVLLYALCTEGIPLIAVADLPYIAGIGLVNTGLAYLLYFYGLQKLSGQSVALISYLDPVSALLFSGFLLHEAMSPIQLIGAALILGGAIVGEK